MTALDDRFTPPAAFIAQVRDALAHLARLPLLSRHPLALRLGYHTGAGAGYALRRELLSAIASVKPALCARPERAERLHQLLQLHYIHHMRLPMVASRLGISLRQAYRDLKIACLEVAEFLWFTHQLGGETLSLPPATGATMERDITPLLTQAIQTLRDIMQDGVPSPSRAVIIPSGEADSDVAYFVVVAVAV